MYTGNTKEETQFLNALWSSHNWGVENGEVKPICECPHCHKGIVMCHYTVGKENGYEFRAYRHVCDTCGEKFEISKIRSDVFFHEAYKWNESLTTPFGEICVTHNGYKC